MMFIAIENMASAFGNKSGNTPLGGSRKEITRVKQKQYDARKALATAVRFTPYDEAEKGNSGEPGMLETARLFAGKNPNTCRYGISGSLRSMLKRVQFESDNGGLKFDTLVFVGHGNTGVMTVGMGCMPLEFMHPEIEREQKGKQANKGKQAKGKQTPQKAEDPTRTVQEMRLEERSINVVNKDTWLGMFEEHKECFSPDKDDTFHVVFAGCSTGNQSELSYKRLTHEVATALAPILDCEVNAYGTDNEIKNDHVNEILANINTIKANATGQQGSYVLTPPQKKLKGINIDWVKKSSN